MCRAPPACTSQVQARLAMAYALSAIICPSISLSFIAFFARMYGAVVPALVVIIARIRLALVAFTISIVSFFAAPIRVAFVRRAQTEFVDSLHAADAVWYFGAASVLFAVRPAGAAPPIAFFAFVLSAIVAARLFGAAVQFARHLGLATVAFAEFHGFAWESAVLVRASMFLAALVPSPHVAARDFVLQDHATVVFAEFHGFAWESAVLVRASMFLAALVPSPHVAARDFVLQDHATVHFAVQATLHDASFAFQLGAGMFLAMFALGSLRSTRHVFCSSVIR